MLSLHTRKSMYKPFLYFCVFIFILLRNFPTESRKLHWLIKISGFPLHMDIFSQVNHNKTMSAVWFQTSDVTNALLWFLMKLYHQLLS